MRVVFDWGLGSILRGLLIGALFLLAAGTARAQQPVPPDTLPRDTLPADPPGLDTLRIARDLPEPDTAVHPDTTAASPPPQLSALPLPADSGFAAGVWIWRRDALLRSAALTVADLLERIPGVLAFRPGYYAGPEATLFGGGAGSTEIFLDGFALDPLTDPAADLAVMPLVNLHEVRVERRADRLRIELETLTSTTAEPYSVVEAQTGEPLGVSSFRGLFLTPRLLIGPFGAGFERLDGNGLGVAEPSNITNAWLQWSWVYGDHGLRFEYRRSDLERGGESPFPSERNRQDVLLRARTAALGEGVVAELYGGGSQEQYEDVVARTELDEDSVEQTVLDTLEVERPSTQLGARISAGRGPVRGLAAVRWRSSARAPALDASLRASVAPRPLLSLSGEARVEQWREAGRAMSLSTRAELGPFAGVRLFAGLDRGRVGAVRLLAPEDTAAVVAEADPIEEVALIERSGLRLGAAWEFGGAYVEGAALRVHADSVLALGAPFDSVGAAYPGGDMSGFEVNASVPLFGGFRVDLAGTVWTDDQLWTYTPAEDARGAIVYHGLPLESGNLEVLARLEAVHRGETLVPPIAGGAPELVPARTTFDGYLYIRIVTVRAFLRYENMTGEPFLDIPGRMLPGLRIIYGVKWELWN